MLVNRYQSIRIGANGTAAKFARCLKLSVL